VRHGVRLAPLVALLLGGAALAAERPPESRAEARSVASVINALEHKDCERVVSRLNDGLAAKYPGIYMLAGALYEDGLCLKASWDRAQRMYQLAHESGHGGGMLKLVAGHALGGRDPAAALWWAQQARQALPPPCVVPEAQRGQPEDFVAVLRNWPPGVLESCLYTAGVMAALGAEAEYPSMALAHSIVGKVEMVFVPASGQITWRTIEVDAQQLFGVASGDTARNMGSRRVRSSLEDYLREVGERVLKRYQRPGGVPASWQMTGTYEFKFE
jgi:hypothetical protein